MKEKKVMKKQKNALEWLEHTAGETPDKLAVFDGERILNYRQLYENSRKIGTAISAFTAPKKPVAVMLEKSTNTLCAFFGIVYAGCFYVLFNPILPIERLKKMNSVLGAEAVITDSEHARKAQEVFENEKVLLAEDLLNTVADDEVLSNIRAGAKDTDPLYVNFTSGSTGVPKGVVISHRNVIDFITVFNKTFRFDKSDVFANQAPFDFDVSVKDIFTSVAIGATLVLVPRKLFSNPAGLLDYLCKNNITVMIWAVSAMCLITTFHALDYRVPQSVKKILFSGEVMPKKHLAQWMEKLPDTLFVNLYGPTEITCNCTYHIISADEDLSNIPIGKAFDNETVFLLGEDNRAVTKADTPGEICVAGTTLSPGYYNNTEQTAKAFVQNPLNPYYSETVYRTGDLGYYDENGNLFFVGRKDFQIKYRGHRIELEEVEKAIEAVEGKGQTFCFLHRYSRKTRTRRYLNVGTPRIYDSGRSA